MLRYAANFSLKYRPAGFTLAEILVVTVLISIITGSVYTLYEVGARAHGNAVAKAEAVSSMRFLHKLLTDKLARKSDDAYSAFMKKDGFLTLGRAAIESIMTADMHSRNEPLYRAAGYSHYHLHDSLAIENIGPAELKSRLPLLPSSRNDALSGPYFYEAAKEAEVLGTEIYKITFDHTPSSVFGASFLGIGNSAVISTNASNETLEINTNAPCDLSILIGPTPPLNVSFTVKASTIQRTRTSVFKMIFFFDSNKPPVETLSPNIAAEDIKKCFIESAFLFCGDGIMFYEYDTAETFINHAFYLEPAPEASAPKTVRYAMAKKENGEWKYYDDAVMTNALKFEFSYFDKNDRPISAPSNDWKWTHAPKTAGLCLELVTLNGGVETPMKMTFLFN